MGSAHLEMILSFVIFVGFIFFILIFIRPLGDSTLTGSVLDGLYGSFLEETQIPLTTFFLKMNQSVVSGCVSVMIPSELVESVGNSSAVYDGGVLKSSELVSGLLLIGPTDSDALEVRVSSEFTIGGLSGCTPLVNYQWGGVVSEDVVSSSSLDLIEGRYANDYENLKGALGVPGIMDFAIVSDGISMSREIPESVDVIVEEHMLRVVYSDGEVNSVRFSFQVW